MMRASTSSPSGDRPSGSGLSVLAALLLYCAAFAAYSPALRGGFVWDDDYHVTRADLRSFQGLGRIWTEMGSTAQYYPALHSAFWMEHRLWGDDPLGYHLVNVFLHAMAACLFIVLLRRLRVPGAVLAGFIFALHPVCVESVAWISEQKNTLSTVFYLLAALAYLKFDERRGHASEIDVPRQRINFRGLAPLYFLATGLFLLALLSKSVTATLPAALLVVAWFRRGRITWRRDALPLVPWFLAAVLGGLLTAWVERRFIGAQGANFDLGPVERCLLAGRVAWFYLGKLVWPSPLIFIYPRWNVSAGAPGQYLFPLLTAGTFWALWLARRRSRAPLAAALLFVGTLFPALGFFNVYPFIFSFVADHFQYLASLGIIALFAAGCDRWQRGVRFRSLPPALIVCVLGILTWRQARGYRDAETLYRTTIARNPGCWMAYANLGTLFVDAGRPQEAIGLLDRALRLKPDFPEEHVDMGDALRAVGRNAEAVAQYEEALRLRPRYPEAHYNLGVVLAAGGRIPEAIAEYREAVRLRPGYAEAHNNLGNVLREAGRIPEAIAEFEAALRLKPSAPEARNNLGIALSDAGRLPDAIAQYLEAVRLRPDYPEAENNLGNALRSAGDGPEAARHYARALALSPGFVEAHYNLAVLLASEGRMAEAARELATTLQLRPGYPEAHNALGNVLRELGRTGYSEVEYKEALRLRPDYAQARHNLALLLHALGRDREAADLFRQASPDPPAPQP